MMQSTFMMTNWNEFCESALRDRGTAKFCELIVHDLAQEQAVLGRVYGPQGDRIVRYTLLFAVPLAEALGWRGEELRSGDLITRACALHMALSLQLRLVDDVIDGDESRPKVLRAAQGMWAMAARIERRAKELDWAWEGEAESLALAVFAYESSRPNRGERDSRVARERISPMRVVPSVWLRDGVSLDDDAAYASYLELMLIVGDVQDMPRDLASGQRTVVCDAVLEACGERGLTPLRLRAGLRNIEALFDATAAPLVAHLRAVDRPRWRATVERVLCDFDHAFGRDKPSVTAPASPPGHEGPDGSARR